MSRINRQNKFYNFSFVNLSSLSPNEANNAQASNLSNKVVFIVSSDNPKPYLAYKPDSISENLLDYVYTRSRYENVAILRDTQNNLYNAKEIDMPDNGRICLFNSYHSKTKIGRFFGKNIQLYLNLIAHKISLGIPGDFGDNLYVITDKNDNIVQISSIFDTQILHKTYDLSKVFELTEQYWKIFLPQIPFNQTHGRYILQHIIDNYESIYSEYRLTEKSMSIKDFVKIINKSERKMLGIDEKKFKLFKKSDYLEVSEKFLLWFYNKLDVIKNSFYEKLHANNNNYSHNDFRSVEENKRENMLAHHHAL